LFHIGESPRRLHCNSQDDRSPDIAERGCHGTIASLPQTTQKIAEAVTSPELKPARKMETTSGAHALIDAADGIIRK
jgi:hypothetical protein